MEPDAEEIAASDAVPAEVPPRRSWRPAMGRLTRLCLKELREILRDRRTIVTLLLMPMLVYPLLSLGFQRMLLTSLDSSRQVRGVIAVQSQADFERVQQILEAGELLIRNRPPRSSGPKEPSSAENGKWPLSEPQIEMNLTVRPKPEDEVASGEADLAVLVQREAAPAGRGRDPATLRCELVSRAGSVLSQTALDYVQERLQAVNEFSAQQQLRALGRRLRYPAQVTRRTVRGPDAALSLTTLIPLILILMTITGAVYPAIDLTAGERERGTLEALMAAPVPRLGLLAAKYVAVVAVALLTAGANLLAMTVTLSATGLSEILFGKSGLSLLVLGQIFALLILFAGFFSAVLLALTSFARSFKEAQAYLIPVMLLSLAPGLISLTPGVEFNALLAVTPLLNIVLLARDLFEGSVDPTLATAAVLTTALYALAAIGLAARVFGTDAILYGSEASWSDLFRRSPRAQPVPSVSGAMFCLALLFPGCFLVRGLLAQLPYDSLSSRLMFNGLSTVVLFAGVPLVGAIVQRLPLQDTFRLHGARPLAFGGAILLGLSLWPMAHEIYLLNEVIGLKALSVEQLDYARKLLAALPEVPLWLVLAALAVAPAVCEELLFRGYVLRALLAATSERNSIVLSAILFGVFHVLTTDALAAGRLLPSTFLGLILGWVAWRTASAVPGMLLHACHNGLLLTLGYYRDELSARGWGVQEQAHMPAAWLAAATLGVIVGLSFVWRKPRPAL
jgi:ABC-2 type transport system permease protein/sodium transport system permease protein